MAESTIRDSIPGGFKNPVLSLVKRSRCTKCKKLPYRHFTSGYYTKGTLYCSPNTSIYEKYEGSLNAINSI